MMSHPENCVKYTCKFTLLGPKAPHDLASLISSSSTDAKAILLFTQTCCPHSLYGLPPAWNSLPLLLPLGHPFVILGDSGHVTSSKKPSLTSTSSTDHLLFFFINFWLHWLFVAACRLSLLEVSRTIPGDGLLTVGNFSCCRARR